MDDPYEASNALLSDVILNYRTIISFGQSNIDRIMEKYEELLADPKSKRILNAHLSGICFGYSMCIRFFFVGVVFYVGAVLIVDYQLSTKAVFQA